MSSTFFWPPCTGEGWKEEETRRRRNEEKRPRFSHPPRSPVVGVSATLKQLNSKTSWEGVARGVRHYANYIMNPSDGWKKGEKMPVDSLGSSGVGCLFFAATDGISARTKREFREYALLSPLSFRSFARLPLAFACLRALRIQAAFLSLFEPLIWLYQLESVPFCPYRSLHSSRSVARTTSTNRAERRHDDPDSSLTL